MGQTKDAALGPLSSRACGEGGLARSSLVFSKMPPDAQTTASQGQTEARLPLSPSCLPRPLHSDFALCSLPDGERSSQPSPCLGPEAHCRLQKFIAKDSRDTEQTVVRKPHREKPHHCPKTSAPPVAWLPSQAKDESASLLGAHGRDGHLVIIGST